MKNLPSHENQDLEKKRTLYSILIIIATLNFASIFSEFSSVFSGFIQFFVSFFLFFGGFTLIRGDYSSLMVGALFNEAHIFF